MQSNRNLLWFVIVGLVAVAGIYYFFVGPGKAPPPPAETSAPAAPAAAPEAAIAPAREAPAEPTAGDITAEEAAKTLKQIEEDQQKEMMAKPPTPPGE